MAPSSNCEQNNTNENNNVDNQNVVGVPDMEKIGGRMLINKLAGEGVVKVVKQCEKAKETLILGKWKWKINSDDSSDRKIKTKIWKYIARPFPMQFGKVSRCSFLPNERYRFNCMWF